MKNNIKYLFLSCLILSTDIFANYAHVIGPQVRESYTLHYGITVRQLDLCTDWACTTPFNLFTGSQYLAVNEKGAVPGAGEISVNLPTSGTYGYIRWKAKNEFQLNGYGLNDTDDTTYCASGSPTKYATEALAKAAATEVSWSMQLDKWLSWGNGVDAPGYGDIIFGYGTGQDNIPGYTSHWSASELNEYTLLIRRDEGNDDFFLTTVLQGD
ncbi:uncharacterized protein METZ01_LOCUS313881, partial [marine metagenome]